MTLLIALCVCVCVLAQCSSQMSTCEEGSRPTIDCTARSAELYYPVPATLDCQGLHVAKISCSKVSVEKALFQVDRLDVVLLYFHEHSFHSSGHLILRFWGVP